MRTGLTLIALLVTAAVFAQDKKTGDEVWKWVDKDGVTHYSDQPGPNSVKVDLRLQTYSPSNTVSSNAPVFRSGTSEAAYRRVAITSPAAETTFRESTVSISVSVEPGLQANHKVSFDIDGQPQGQAAANLSISLTDMSRGTHVVRASIVSADGTVLIQSDPVTFFVHQPSLLSPNRPR